MYVIIVIFLSHKFMVKSNNYNKKLEISIINCVCPNHLGKPSLLIMTYFFI